MIVDFHTHILPGMDDGSDTVATSAKMMERLQQQQVTHVCLTPHYYKSQESVSLFLERRAQAFQQLKLLQTSDDIQFPTMFLGAEVLFYSGMSQSEELDQLCFAGTKTLLLEMPNSDWNMCQVNEVISLTLERNYHVVLAHPERFMKNSSYWNYMGRLTELPIVLQINADSLCSWRMRAKVLDLIRQSKYTVLGSDCHDMKHRSAHLAEARNIIAKKLGESFLHEMDEMASKLIKQ